MQPSSDRLGAGVLITKATEATQVSWRSPVGSSLLIEDHSVLLVQSALRTPALASLKGEQPTAAALLFSFWSWLGGVDEFC